jgi:hypothetical protein
MQVRHVAGEKLDVGPAHPGTFDVHHDLAGLGHGRLDLGHGELARAGEYERPHAPPSRIRRRQQRMSPARRILRS